MNSIRQTQALNKLELANAVPPSASWHADYRDTAYIYVGGLPFDVSEGDRFMTISEHDGDDFVYGANYLGIARSDDLVIIQFTVSNTRSVQQKQQLYRHIVELLAESPGLRAEDVFINLVEVLPENWSFGHGEAQYIR